MDVEPYRELLPSASDSYIADKIMMASSSTELANLKVQSAGTSSHPKGCHVMT